MGCSQSKIEISPASTKVHSDEDYVEKVVCHDKDLQENEMKTFDLEGDSKVLLVKQKGKISALGHKCTHYGAPLVNGALGDGRIRCQWHGACFNIETGDIEDFPGLDSLPCHQVTIESDGGVRVRAKKSALENTKRIKTMTKRNEKEAQSIVVIGGGPAGATCVETLRQEGYQGKITMVCRENCLPYDRIKVSKAMDFEIDKAQFRDAQFYRDHDIDVIKGVAATAVDCGAKTVALANGQRLDYDKLFIATGCKPRKVDVPGFDLQNVVVLRDYEDAKYTNAQLSADKEVVVLGSSFIALESAAYCLGKVKNVTIVARTENPFEPFLGLEIGRVFRKLFEDKGINYIPNSGFKQCIGEDCKVTSVELVDGTILKADLVIMGTGSTYYTDFLKSSSIQMQPNGAINCDEFLRTNEPDVYVGGDIAYAPVWSHGNTKAAIGHYPLAHYHGRIAALNLLRKNTPLRAVPYFWTMLFGKGLRYAGFGGKFSDIIYHGNIDELKFVAFYMNNDEATAAASVNMDPVVSQFAELLAQGKKVTRSELQQDPLKWVEKLHQN